VLCIAHRLNTILSYDRVLVMESGSACELGTPGELLANTSGRFSQMVAKYGTGAAEQILLEGARAANAEPSIRPVDELSEYSL